MTRRKVDLYPIVFGPSETIDATEDEDLTAPAVPRHRWPTSPRAHRRLEAAALCAAVLICGVFAMAHGPRGTPGPVPTQAVTAPQDRSPAVVARIGLSDFGCHWSVPAARRQTVCVSDRGGPGVAARYQVATYQMDWATQRAGERASGRVARPTEPARR
jgi:hypothetical protein